MSEPAAIYRSVSIRDLDPEALLGLSRSMKLALDRDDMIAVQAYFREKGREPTDVELEVIAQTWSEHCKHRIFGAEIRHTVDGREEIVDGLFKTFIRATSERIMAHKPGFVLSAFVDNAGFIALDESLAVCLKVETHNHPSAIEPYAGANTGLGGVIRDILGAGKGAKPVASIDVFCFGPPDTKQADLKAADVIHPLGIMRGVVRGVRDYGNRIGIPTVNGAIQFDPSYTYNPLVFCGTAGVIPQRDIAKKMRPGLAIVAVGGRTGRDGLKGATFSSVSLTTDSHAEDQSAVQIGNPIEEKKVSDLILEARAEGLIEFVTDCGAGGFSSAAGEMLSQTGGELTLERAPLKEEGLASWQIFLSESQERMVVAVERANLDRLRELSRMYESELAELGHSDGTGILKVRHHGELVCELDCVRLHEAPRRRLVSCWDRGVASGGVAFQATSHPSAAKPRPTDPRLAAQPDITGRLEGDPTMPRRLEGDTTGRDGGLTGRLEGDPTTPRLEDDPTMLRTLLADFAICSREPIIREYDHQVQGNTVLTPLAGACGDAPQDAAVIRVDECPKLVAIACSLLPEWGKTDPRAMGRAVVDECVRQLVATGADPDRIAILDNFCLGNPDEPRELGALVECVKGLAEAAEAYDTPFISGKDSFHNYFMTSDGPVSIPVTALVSGLGIVSDTEHVTGSSLRRSDSELFLLGPFEGTPLGGSVVARIRGITDQRVPKIDFATHLATYRVYHQAVVDGLVLSCHDIGEGGLAVTLAEMAFSMVAGLEIETEAPLFAEPTGCLVVEIATEHRDHFIQRCGDLALDFVSLGYTTDAHRRLVIHHPKVVLDEPLNELKAVWKGGLAAWY